MKKVSALLIMFSAIFSSISSYGQRNVDLSVMLNTPANGTTLPASQAFNFQVLLVNNGPDSLKATDTLAFFVTMDTSSIPVSIMLNGQAATTFGTTGSTIPPNTGGQIPATMAFATPPPAGAHSFCINVGIINRSADSVRDNVAGNNKSCNSITIAAGGTGITGMASPESRIISIYPNPTPASATIQVELAHAVQAHISLMDINGRTVYTEIRSLPAGPSNAVLNVSAIPAGLYNCIIQIGSTTHTERLVVAH